MADFPLLNEASLVMIPGAYKEGKIYSQLPTDGSGDFTYTRGTDTATRVNEAGNIEKGYENLLYPSNNLTSLCSNNFNGTASDSNQIANPVNGEVTADKLYTIVSGTSENRARISGYIQNGVQTISMYAKYIDYKYLYIRQLASSNNQEAIFDIELGEITFDNLLIESKIEPAGNGWYRCSITFNASSISNNLIDIGLSGSATAFRGNIQDGVEMYFFGYMLNQGLVAYPYLETTTVPVYAGLTDNMPRLDYTDATCPSLLLEPSRTNLINSMLFNDINGASYTISETKVGIGMPLQHFTKTAVGQYAAHILSNQSVSAGDIYTFSTFFKPISSDSGFHKIGMYFNNQSDFIYYDYARNGFFNDLSGTPLPSNKYVEDYANGVYRLISIQTAVADGNRVDLNIESYYNTNSQFLCGYAQIEEGSYPTSYIPTYGSTQTRAADVSSVTKAVSSEGSLFINVGGTSQPKLSVLGEYFDASTTENKVAIAYSSTALVISHNGSIVVDKTGTYDVSSLTQIQLGHSNGSDQADSPISEFVTFDSFLTNSELNALTQ